jgi:hypothetical protein
MLTKFILNSKRDTLYVNRYLFSSTVVKETKVVGSIKLISWYISIRSWVSSTFSARSPWKNVALAYEDSWMESSAIPIPRCGDEGSSAIKAGVNTWATPLDVKFSPLLPAPGRPQTEYKKDTLNPIEAELLSGGTGLWNVVLRRKTKHDLFQKNTL